MNPLTFSIIVPLYNKIDHVASTLTGLRAELSAGDEIIVVDDCSSDGSDIAAQRFADAQLCVVRTPVNSGPATARNLGAHCARGDFLLFFDADDEPRSNMLHVLREVVGKFPKESVFCFAIAFEAHGEGNRTRRRALPADPQRSTTVLPLDAFADSALKGGFLCTASSTCVSRSAFIQSGGFASDLRYCEDPELWARLSSIHRIVCIPEVLATYRNVPASLSQIMRIKVGAVQPYVETLLKLAVSRGPIYAILARRMIRKNVIFARASGATGEDLFNYIDTNRHALGLPLSMELYWLALMPVCLLQILLRLRNGALQYHAAFRARHFL